MATSFAEKTYTIEEYLELEKNSETRHEFHYGKLIELPKESRISSLISNNILKKWDDSLEEQGYFLFSHDIKAQIKKSGLYRYPDILVTPESDDEDDYMVKKPIIIVEVASEDSWRTDTFTKRKEYTALPSLKYYVIVSQVEMYVELYSREGNNWSFNHFELLDETIELPDFNLKITLPDIYHRVKFGDAKTDVEV